MSTTDDRIALVEEQVSVEKRWITTGTVRVHTETQLIDELVRVDLSREQVEVTRVRLDRVVDAPSAIRTDGDVTIIPVFEERLVVEKRLVLVEEIHVSRRTISTEEKLPVTLRKQHAVINRIPPTDQGDD